MINGSNTDKLMKKINYKFKNEEYLKEALTHMPMKTVHLKILIMKNWNF